jgi:hypothetical protein
MDARVQRAGEPGRVQLNAFDLATSGPAAGACFSALGGWFEWNDGECDDGTFKLASPGRTERTLCACAPEDLEISLSVVKQRSTF